MIHLPLSRRTILRGLGASIAIPALEALQPRNLLAQTARPQRLVLQYIPNGWPFDGSWGYDGPYQPAADILADIRGDYSCLYAMNNRTAIEHEELHGAHDGHGKTACTVLNGQVPSDLGNKLYGIPRTADQVLAAELYGDWKFPSLGVNLYPVGTIDSFHQPIHTNCISWKGPNDPAYLYADPRELFDQMFAGVMSGTDDAGAAARRARKKSILDTVISDVEGLSPKIAVSDRHRLDEYLTSLRKVESEIDATMNQACSVPGAPLSEETLISTYASRYDAMMDLMVKAFECDMTRVFQFMVGNETMVPSYLPNVGSDWHSFSHDDYGQCKNVIGWHLQKYKALVQRLSAIQEADGNTMLDNSTIVFFSAQGDSGSHATWNLNALVAGKGGGKFQPGSDIRVDGEVTNLWLTILQDYGVAVSSFGSSNGTVDALRA